MSQLIHINIHVPTYLVLQFLAQPDYHWSVSLSYQSNTRPPYQQMVFEMAQCNRYLQEGEREGGGREREREGGGWGRERERERGERERGKEKKKHE